MNRRGDPSLHAKDREGINVLITGVGKPKSSAFFLIIPPVKFPSSIQAAP